MDGDATREIVRANIERRGHAARTRDINAILDFSITCRADNVDDVGIIGNSAGCSQVSVETDCAKAGAQSQRTASGHRDAIIGSDHASRRIIVRVAAARSVGREGECPARIGIHIDRGARRLHRWSGCRNWSG